MQKEEEEKKSQIEKCSGFFATLYSDCSKYFFLLYRSHCCNCALSTPSPNNYFDGGCKDLHPDECVKCSLTCDLFDILEGFLLDQVLMSGFSRHEVDILINDIQSSKMAVQEFQRFIVRSKVQSREWQKLFELKVCMCVCCFATPNMY